MRNGRRSIRVWDLPTRLFHWLAVLLVAGAYATWRLDWMGWHERLGYTLFALLLFRVIWGFVGSDTARFARFLASPAAAWRYLRHALRREPDALAGHNPAGGWMVVVLLLLLLGETLTGIYVASDVADVGPLTAVTPAAVADAIDAAHALLWDALLAAIALHVLAIIAYAAIKGQNLLWPMITGTKRLSNGAPPPRLAGASRGVLVLVGSIAAAALIVHLM
ncbi:MAG TPA: cytochrome b/b6 domain-containing protein [Stellaceae bacterium]|nr:cytochrome b/b6 domain-containing protein [Stellaceae bacterium]